MCRCPASGSIYSFCVHFACILVKVLSMCSAYGFCIKLYEGLAFTVFSSVVVENMVKDCRYEVPRCHKYSNVRRGVLCMYYVGYLSWDTKGFHPNLWGGECSKWIREALWNGRIPFGERSGEWHHSIGGRGKFQWSGNEKGGTANYHHATTASYFRSVDIVLLWFVG